jgi:pyruvate,orthophosphate dikinase
MKEKIEICTLDYLIGTLATAYKGLVTSLIAKNFCITEEERVTVFKGTILSMPKDGYSASLVHTGIEIARAPIEDGYFELRAGSDSLRRTKNLQIDVIQKGKHIGTFLLRKEQSGGVFSSALELTEELEGINLRLLNESVKTKKGLLKKAEALIASIVSTKKDWRKLAAEINTFAKDVFWSDREAFHRWFSVFARFTVKACLNVHERFREKTILNLLSIIELPLEKEEDEVKLSALVGVWMEEIDDYQIDLSLRHGQSMRVINMIHGRLPLIEAESLMKTLLSSISTRIAKTPFISGRILSAFGSIPEAKDWRVLEKYSEEKVIEIKEELDEIQRLLDSGKGLQEIMDLVTRMDLEILDETPMIKRFFEVCGKNLAQFPARTLTPIFTEIFTQLGNLSSSAYRVALPYAHKLMNMLIELEKHETFIHLLSHLDSVLPNLRDDMVLDADIARSILNSKEVDLISQYGKTLKKIIVPPPRISGFSDETWAEITNPDHLRRLKSFLTIIGLDTQTFRDILIHLICNLSISGVFIPDEKIFQRDVSAYLNSGNRRVDYLFHYLLLKRFPVYYNEVGASGRIRDLTTEIDSWGNDPVIYFLRKQVHVNASNYDISIIKNIIRAWVFNEANLLVNTVPDEVYENLNSDLLSQYSSAIRPVFESLGIVKGREINFQRLLQTAERLIEEELKSIDATDEVREKVKLICRIFREVKNKYALSRKHEEKKAGIEQELSGYLERLVSLKERAISTEKTSSEESLYFKRHIAFGIPSVIGSYHEPKFDAFGGMLKVEEEVRVHIENEISDIERRGRNCDLEDITEWINLLDAVNQLFKLYFIDNYQIDEIMTLMRTNRLHVSQIIDLLRGWQNELTWIVEVLFRTFHKSFIELLRIYPADDLPANLKRLNPGEESFVNKAADILMRDIISSILGLEELDRLLNSIIKSLTFNVASGPDSEVNISAMPEIRKDFFILDNLTSKEAMRMAPLLGSKAKNLVYLKNQGLPVPAGVVFPSLKTSTYQEYTESGEFKEALRDAVKDIEEKTKFKFGSPERPLFLSVRSGSYISMPGILSSILYCGMNEDTLQGFIVNTGNSWLAWDSYRRFIEHYATIAMRLDGGEFNEILQILLQEFGAESPQKTDAHQMEEIVKSYRTHISGKGCSIPDDVYEQLRHAVKGIYMSWFDERAIQFRDAMNISDHWGTAVTLMHMIHGNDMNAGASVFFTRKPLSLEKGIYGETREASTGDDIVYGKMMNRPIAEDQSTDMGESLEGIDRDLFLLHRDLGERVEDAMGGLPQEIEAAYVKEKGHRKVYILQTKRMEFHRGYTEKFHDICKMESSVIGRGIGVHGGAMSGVATFSHAPEYVKELKLESEEPVILLRQETSTDDVALMPEIDGILTAVGGATSHAAILSQKFGLTAVVGCSDIEFNGVSEGKPFAILGDYRIEEGASISIDGSTGLVYSGVCMLTVQKDDY